MKTIRLQEKRLNDVVPSHLNNHGITKNSKIQAMQ